MQAQRYAGGAAGELRFGVAVRACVSSVFALGSGGGGGAAAAAVAGGGGAALGA